MHTEGPGATVVCRTMRCHALDEVPELAERTERLVHRRGHRGWTVAGNAMLGDQRLDRFERSVVAFHYVVPGTAMNMKVDEPGRENRILEIDGAASLRDLDAIATADLLNHAFLKDDNPVVNAVEGSENLACKKSGLHGTILVEKVQERGEFAVVVKSHPAEHG